MNQHVRIPTPEATYQDILDAPEGVIAEIIDGTLYTQPRPASPHGQAADGLLAETHGPFQRGKGGPGGWWIKAEPEIHFGGKISNALVPDLAGWRRETLPVYPRVPYMTVTPDWVGEVLSPSTEARDRGKKADIYAEYGVAHYWIIDPEAETLEVFSLTEGKWLRLGAWAGEVDVTAAPFEAITLQLGDFWLPKA